MWQRLASQQRRIWRQLATSAHAVAAWPVLSVASWPRNQHANLAGGWRIANGQLAASWPSGVSGVMVALALV